MPTITVISWNIQHLGAAKTTSIAAPPDLSDIVPLIALVIQRMVADVVGIMEVNSGLGNQIKDWLISRLNNAPGATGTWAGRVSARQDGGTQEEYVYLWREQANRLTLDPAGRPAPISLVGVVDDNLLEPLTVANAWDEHDRAALYAALAANGYIVLAGYGTGGHTKTETWRVVPAAWAQLNGMGLPEVAFASEKVQPPAALTGPGGQAQRQALARMLLDTDMLLFLTYPERSPFLANFRVGTAPGKPLAVSLFHTLGTGNTIYQVGAANNTVGLSLPLAAAAEHGNVLLMGDWNVPANRMNAEVVRYTREDRDRNAKFCRTNPAQKDVVFSTITGGNLNAANLSGTVLTSMKSTFLPDDVPADEVLKNAYDKFFYHSATPPDPAIDADGDPMVLNLTPYLVATSPDYDPDLARLATAFFRVYKGEKRAQTVLKTSTDLATIAQASLMRAQAKLAPLGPGGASVTIRKTVRKRRKKSAADDVATCQTKYDTYVGQATTAQTLIHVVNLPTQVAATGNGSAAAMYNAAVSDHVPIALRLRA